MKYINMMAGAFGLMALAACSNNDEVTVEQPQVARTITVTYGNGADTRMTLSEFDATEGIKGAWESTDTIGVVDNSTESPKVFTYKSTGSGPSVVFTLDGEEGPTEGQPYGIFYPKSALTDGYDFRTQTGLQKDLKNYAHAMTIVDSFSALDNKVTLTPICSFLYIPKGTVFPGLSVEGSRTIEVEGNNLRPSMPGSSEETSIFVEVGSLFNGDTTTDDLYIALPFRGKTTGTNITYTPITNLQFTIMPLATTKVSIENIYTYSIVKDASVEEPVPVEITGPGNVYVLAATNLHLDKK